MQPFHFLERKCSLCSHHLTSVCDQFQVRGVTIGVITFHDESPDSISSIRLHINVSKIYISRWDVPGSTYLQLRTGHLHSNEQPSAGNSTAKHGTVNSSPSPPAGFPLSVNWYLTASPPTATPPATPHCPHPSEIV